MRGRGENLNKAEILKVIKATIILTIVKCFFKLFKLKNFIYFLFFLLVTRVYYRGLLTSRKEYNMMDG